MTSLVADVPTLYSSDRVCLILQIEVARFDDNQLTGTIPRMADTAVLLNFTDNRLSGPALESLPTSLQVLYLANNAITGTLPDPSVLPSNLTVLDVSGNRLSGSLPQALPVNLTVLDASNNALTGTLPSGWSRLAELKLDNMQLTGKLPSGWSAWGKNTSNSIQLSLVNTSLGGHVPQQWVEQFCLASVRTSEEQVLFNATPVNVGFFNHVGMLSAPIQNNISVGSPITLIAQHASINVTLKHTLYSFSYEDPASVCSIPYAVRNAALLWGMFAVLLLATAVGLRFWLRRKRSNVPTSQVAQLTVLTAVFHNKSVQASKRVAALLWVFLSDVLWFIYSQVTDAITVHQVSRSGHKSYAVILLAILLIPYMLVFILVVLVCVRHAQSLVDCSGHHRFVFWLCKFAAAFAGLALSPFLFLGLEFGMLAEAVGLSVAHRILPASCDLATLYRAKSVAEALFNAFPQAVIQTKLYIMGNDPNGVHVYIDTTLFMASVFGSLVSVLKTFALLQIELHQYGFGVLLYFRKLLVLAPFKRYTGLQSQVSPGSLQP